VAELMLAECPVEAHHIVLEPSAGEGDLAAVLTPFPLNPTHLHLIELDVKRSDRLASRFPGCRVIQRDFLEVEPVNCFDRVYMNPPFAIEGSGSVWIDHVQHAKKFVAPDGYLAAIVPASIRFRSDTKHKQFREGLPVGRIIRDLPEKAFSESGTGVNACLLIIPC
jgi:hypothetical protein